MARASRTSTRARARSSSRRRAESVLVTGADTPIGERLIRELLDDSRVSHILAVTAGDPADFPLQEGDRLEVLKVDISRNRRLHDLLFGKARDLGTTSVIHTAMHHSAHARGSRVHALNVEATRALLGFAERHPTIRRIVVRSASEVYQVNNELPDLISEEHPLNMGGRAPQWVRDRVEADVTACTRMGLSSLDIVVLRMTEALAPGTGSQLFDWLESPVCLRPAGFDPMVNVLTIDDSVTALQKALHSDAQGVFNIPGADSLPLSAAIRAWGRVGVPLPGFLLAPAYRWRRRLTGTDFRYGMNRFRFHYSGVLDGTRAREVLGFVPSHPVEWPARSG